VKLAAAKKTSSRVAASIRYTQTSRTSDGLHGTIPLGSQLAPQLSSPELPPAICMPSSSSVDSSRIDFASELQLLD